MYAQFRIDIYFNILETDFLIRILSDFQAEPYFGKLPCSSVTGGL